MFAFLAIEKLFSCQIIVTRKKNKNNEWNINTDYFLSSGKLIVTKENYVTFDIF